MPTKKKPEKTITLKRGLLKGVTVTSHADYTAKLKAEQERLGVAPIIRRRKGESVEASVTRALEANKKRKSKGA